MTRHISLIGLFTLTLAACNRQGGDPGVPEEDMFRQAEVELESADGAEIEGSGTFEEDVGGVRLVLYVEDAAPGAKGVHIHEKGDCSDIAGKSMGGHFSPDQHEHALPSERGTTERHLGDMGNIQVGEDGEGTLNFLIRNATLRAGEPNSLIGKAVVVHAGQDQGEASQPSGSSGPPIACGVIEES